VHHERVRMLCSIPIGFRTSGGKSSKLNVTMDLRTARHRRRRHYWDWRP